MKAIAAQNDQLKNIAWTQSHVVRAPVARLLGLVDLLKSGQLNADEKDQILEHISTSAKELDEVIHEIVGESQSVINISTQHNEPKNPHN